MESIKAGDTVKARPIGQGRIQTILVTRVEDGAVYGYLVSKKYPGNFRGTAVAWEKDCVKE